LPSYQFVKEGTNNELYIFLFSLLYLSLYPVLPHLSLLSRFFLLFFHCVYPDFNGDLKIASIIEFVNKGGNLLVAASSDISESIRDLAIEFSVDFDESGTGVIDHFHRQKSDETTHTLISSSNVNHDTYIIKKSDKSNNPILFRGVGARLTGKNPLAVSVLSGEKTAFSYNLKTDYVDKTHPASMGSKTVLVSALQARNNARVVFSGSIDLFSDR